MPAENNLTMDDAIREIESRHALELEGLDEIAKLDAINAIAEAEAQANADYWSKFK